MLVILLFTLISLTDIVFCYSMVVLTDYSIIFFYSTYIHDIFLLTLRDVTLGQLMN